MVSGPLKRVREDMRLATVTDPSQATFAGPGASRASRVVGFPQMVSAVQEREGLVSRSGMVEAIVFTVLVWEFERVAIASAGVARRCVVWCFGVKGWKGAKADVGVRSVASAADRAPVE